MLTRQYLERLCGIGLIGQRSVATGVAPDHDHQLSNVVTHIVPAEHLADAVRAVDLGGHDQPLLAHRAARFALGIVVCDRRLFDALAETIIGLQLTSSGFHAIDVEVQKLLAPPAAFGLVLGLSLLDPRARVNNCQIVDA